jgi:hypothetical protein
MIRGPFLVTPNVPTLEFIRGLLQQSRVGGVHGRVSKSLGEIEGHLELHPESWGEVLHAIPQFQTTVYIKVHDGIAVKYAVHDIQSKVFVMQMIVLPGHPLAAPH